MKIKQEHLDHIKKVLLDRYETHFPAMIESYETGLFPRADKTKDLQRRFCFDLMWGAELSTWVTCNLYGYMNDDHLYTALKSFLPTVTRRY